MQAAANLRHQINELILQIHGRGLWPTRPDHNYEDAVETLINDIVEVAHAYKEDEEMPVHKVHDRSVLYEPTDESERIGKRIQKHRIQKGWSVTKMAIVTNLNSQYLRNVERGEPILSTATLKRVIESLDISSSDVLDY